MSNEQQSTEWVEVHTFEGDIMAEMVSEALENAGIPNEIVRSMLASGLGAHSVSLAGNTAKIRVPEEHADTARDIISNILSEKE